MTPQEFKMARQKLGLSLMQLSAILDTDPRTIRKWEAIQGNSARKPNPVASQVMKWLLDGFRPPEWPTQPPSTPSPNR